MDAVITGRNVSTRTHRVVGSGFQSPETLREILFPLAYSTSLDFMTSFATLADASEVWLGQVGSLLRFPLHTSNRSFVDEVAFVDTSPEISGAIDGEVETVATSIRESDVEFGRSVLMHSLLGEAAAGAFVERSALELLDVLSEETIAAVGLAMAMTPELPPIESVAGSTNPDDPDWRQLVLTISSPGQPGSPEWRRNLATAGRVVEVAVESFPWMAREIAEGISFAL
ncbi:MAG: hypothetical protein AB7J35_00695 [Dehalococcoidia bacterium]